MNNLIRKTLPFAFLIIAFGCGAGKQKPRNNQQVMLEDTHNSYSTEESNRSKNEPGYDRDKITNTNDIVTTDLTSVYLKDGDDGKFNPLGSSAASFSGGASRKFIKTADLKFRVKSAIHATYEIEDLTRKYNGFVTYTKLESRIDGTTVIPISPDSSLETVYYTVTNSMTIRVPQDKLDSVLRSFTPLVDYLDHRTIEVVDVYFMLLRKQLEQERLKNYQNRVKRSIDSKGKNLNDITDSEETVLSRQEQADNAKVESLELLDKIEYSTITLNMYQRQAIKRELVFNGKNIEAYEPGLGYKLKHALKNGWNAFIAIVLFVLQFWVLMLVGIIVFVVFRKYNKKFK